MTGSTRKPMRSSRIADGLLEGVKYDPAHVEAGTLLYVSNCVFCHGVPGVDKGGNIKNLGYVSTAPHSISLGGLRTPAPLSRSLGRGRRAVPSSILPPIKKRM